MCRKEFRVKHLKILLNGVLVVGGIALGGLFIVYLVRFSLSVAFTLFTLAACYYIGLLGEDMG